MNTSNDDIPSDGTDDAPAANGTDAREARVLAVLLGDADSAEQTAVAALLHAHPDLRAWRDKTEKLLPALLQAARADTATPDLRMDEARRAALLEKLSATPDAAIGAVADASDAPPDNVIPWKTFLRQNRVALAACAVLAATFATVAAIASWPADNRERTVATQQPHASPAVWESMTFAADGQVEKADEPPPPAAVALSVPSVPSPPPPASTPTAPAPKMVPLKIQVPELALTGTPVPVPPSLQQTLDLGQSLSAANRATRDEIVVTGKLASSGQLTKTNEGTFKIEGDSTDGFIGAVVTSTPSSGGYTNFRRTKIEGGHQDIATNSAGEDVVIGGSAGGGSGGGFGPGYGREGSGAIGAVVQSNTTRTAGYVSSISGKLSDGNFENREDRAKNSGNAYLGNAGRYHLSEDTDIGSGAGGGSGGPVISRRQPAVPRNDTDAAANPFSTFSLNVSDAAFRLAAESLRQLRWPDAATLRTEEFVNALTYADPPPATGEAVSLTQEQARDPFTHNRNLLRLTVQTASAGRNSRQPLNLTILLDTSGSMERADRQATLAVALRALADYIKPQDTVSLIGFARTPRLFFQETGAVARQSLLAHIGAIPPEGGTNLELALNAAYAQNRKTATPTALNRVVLLTDGAANLGDANPTSLAALIAKNKKLGTGLDCYGIGFDDYNDILLETLARTANGRYAYLNNADDAREDFAKKLAGALQVAAQNVKVQLEFNPARVSAWRLLGYEKHRLKKEDFRDNTVAAAELGAAENGTAVYSVALDPNGTGDIGTLRVRYQDPRTGDYHERDWTLPYDPTTPALDHAAPGIKLAAAAALFAEKLEALPQAESVPLKALETLVRTANAAQPPAPANQQLQTMIEQARRAQGSVTR
ncbi:MAG: von Willebrand factor type A domain-containing protein [Puniceicoccales bacterium]|jgi:Mg-chelatase subunit ChlD|nr:von Willebrand factor type A domain-containing protein [Puniceicoccales bacterium]